MFATVLRKIKSPKNVGMIVRSHVAFGGGPLLFLGYDSPWQFKAGTQAFSRKLEHKCDVLYMRYDDDFFNWCQTERRTPVAIEIATPSTLSHEFDFPVNAALILGSESKGLSKEFSTRCEHIVTVPQAGPVGSLNVAVSCSIVMYEYNRSNGRATNEIEGAKFINERGE